jgi:hypothetical protein
MVEGGHTAHLLPAGGGPDGVDHMATEHATHANVIDYTVDDEPQQTTEHTLTPTQVLSNAGIDPHTHYLVEIRGAHKISYQDKPSEPIHMHEKQTFVSNASGPTPVS